ncbi:T-cell surface protein tactile isoform X2 [Mastomys coucha]|uniref:T-cell surface protein tactile isoform X2 n=1 Tax=Mastomys coucha TaxID=35658 RepID=UPI00126271A1|nr:T-cell surface protein tactile isoform X2 [Mastomys coucha]
MKRKWTHCVVCAIIQIQFFRGVWEELFNVGDNMYALPGSDVNLTCQTKEKDFLVQMQWSKVTDKTDIMIALYHPTYGFYCRQGHACESQVAAIETPKGITNWTLYLRNISSTHSGKYKCIFTLYPEGIKTTVYNLIVEPYTQEEHNRTIEIETNRTLEIPCFQNTSSESSPSFTFSWLVEKGGVEEVLFTHDHHVNNSTSFKGRVGLGADYGLHLSPVQIQDDGRTFSCRLSVSPVKAWKMSTTVKVFAKPEILMTVENSTMDVLGERVFTCLLKNVFPKANITWLIDGRFLQGNDEGIYITNEEKNGSSGFRELKSVFIRMHKSPSQSNNMTVCCMALSPGPGNKMWNTSSQPITFSLVSDSVIAPTRRLPNGTHPTLGTQPFPDAKVSPTRYLATSSVTIVDENVLTPDATLRTSRPASSSNSGSWPFPSTSPPEWWPIPDTSTGPQEPDTPVSWIPSEVHASVPSDASLAPHDAIISTTKEFPDALTTADGTTKIDHGPITSIIVNKPRDGMSWPVLVAALLCFCILLFGIGVRKWCQYQKEITEREMFSSQHGKTPTFQATTTSHQVHVHSGTQWTWPALS